jgi:hypothetical protein
MIVDTVVHLWPEKMPDANAAEAGSATGEKSGFGYFFIFADGCSVSF